eukprot:1532019-Rhodomonas_salina.8
MQFQTSFVSTVITEFLTKKDETNKPASTPRLARHTRACHQLNTSSLLVALSAAAAAGGEGSAVSCSAEQRSGDALAALQDTAPPTRPRADPHPAASPRPCCARLRQHQHNQQKHTPVCVSAIRVIGITLCADLNSKQNKYAKSGVGPHLPSAGTRARALPCPLDTALRRAHRSQPPPPHHAARSPTLSRARRASSRGCRRLTWR